MACPDNNPCNNNYSPCDGPYDNCGCPNPNTFGCTTTNKVRECLGTTSGEDGESVLDKIEAKICDIGKVKLSATDTCPAFLEDKIEEGTNINISYTGSGCDRRMVIAATVGGVPVDVKVKTSVNDDTNDYLYEKIAVGQFLTKDIQNPGGVEKVLLDLNIAEIISEDLGNEIVLGDDGKIKTSYTAPDGSETILERGTGVQINGTGTVDDPYIISTNPSIQVARSCFDGTWKTLPLIPSGNANVVRNSGVAQYRFRFDGSVEFRGSVTHTIAFGNYQSGSKTYTITLGGIPTDCLSAGELSGTIDLKSINYIDNAQASADQIVQQYGYIIRKNGQNIQLVFQSAFTANTSKTVVVNFDGAVIHPVLV